MRHKIVPALICAFGTMIASHSAVADPYADPYGGHGSSRENASLYDVYQQYTVTGPGRQGFHTYQPRQGNHASVVQNGVNNSAAISQSGHSNTATISQHGHNNNANIGQRGVRSTVHVNQVGNNLSLDVSQQSQGQTSVIVVQPRFW